MSEEKDFWSEGPDTADVMPDSSASRTMVSGMGDAEGAGELITSAIEGFVTGGLPGMLRALDTNPDYDPDNGPEIDDPDALARAEAAVRGDDASEGGLGDAPRLRPIDEDMVPIATQTVTGQYSGLEDVLRALASDGIDAGWDPYDPRDLVAFTPPGVGTGTMKLFAVVVPVSQVERARQCLYGAPPQGVEYAWPATPGVTPSAEVDTRYGFPEVPPLTFAPPVPDMPAGRVTPVTGYGSSLSDNEALEEMSQPTSSGAGVAIALIGVLAAVATAVYFILLKG